MPKKYREIKEKKIKALLTTQQIKRVDDVGDFVDEQIELKPSSNHVHINDCIWEFRCDHETLDPLTFPEPERALMEDLLVVRYRDAGWRLQHIDLTWELFMRDF